MTQKTGHPQRQMPADGSSGPPLVESTGRAWLVSEKIAARPVRYANSEAAMAWATHYIAKLETGETVQLRPRGNSMAGKIESGQLCTVVPIDDPAELAVGDIVLCKVNGSQYIHLIKAIQGPRFQIGNNRGRINGWITANSIYGKCIKIED